MLCIDTESGEWTREAPQHREGQTQTAPPAPPGGGEEGVLGRGSLEPSQVALAVQGCREGLVVKGTWHGIRALVRRHAGDAILSLVGGQLSPQLLGCDEVLGAAGRDSGPPAPHTGPTAPPCWPQVLRRVWLTLSPARTLKEAMTWSAVSVSVVSLDMKSMKAWKVTRPLWLGSTTLMMRLNSASPCEAGVGGGRQLVSRAGWLRPAGRTKPGGQGPTPACRPCRHPASKRPGSPG